MSEIRKERASKREAKELHNSAIVHVCKSKGEQSRGWIKQ